MNQWLISCLCVALAAGTAHYSGAASADEPVHSAAHGGSHVLGSIQGMNLTVAVFPDGSYSITSNGSPADVIRSDVEAELDAGVLRSSAYPRHTIVQSEMPNEFGSGPILTVTHTGLAGTPDLVTIVRLYRDQAWGDIETKVLNTTDRAISVASIRSVHST